MELYQHTLGNGLRHGWWKYRADQYGDNLVEVELLDLRYLADQEKDMLTAVIVEVGVSGHELTAALLIVATHLLMRYHHGNVGVVFDEVAQKREPVDLCQVNGILIHVDWSLVQWTFLSHLDYFQQFFYLRNPTYQPLMM